MHGLDLRDLRGVETFCAFIAERHEALDILVNNACQTVRRPARYYATLVEGERRMSLTDGSGGDNGIAVVSCVEIKFWVPHAIDATPFDIYTGRRATTRRSSRASGA